MNLLEKDRTLFGLKVFNHNTKELGLILYTWINVYFVIGGDREEIVFATCVDPNGKKYNTELSNIEPVEDMDDEDLIKYGLK